MSRIEIERKTLQLLLNRYFEADVEARAYRALASRGSVKNPDIAIQYALADKSEVEKQRVQTEGIRRRLTETLTAENDPAFFAALGALFPIPGP